MLKQNTEFKSTRREVSSPGFTLIELLLVITLIALIGGIVVPRFRAVPAKKTFLQQFNALLQLGYNHAITTQKKVRLFFDFKKKMVTLEEEDRTTASSDSYKPVTIPYLKTTITWPEEFIVQSFYINEKVDPGAITTIYFIIMPQGLSQRVTINIQDTRTDDVFALVVNPFLVQATLYDEVQKV